MLNAINVTTFPVIFPPAAPSLADMLGASIEYINARPYERTPLHAIGTVIGYAHRRGELFLKVQNATTCRERWIPESDFVRYVH